MWAPPQLATPSSSFHATGLHVEENALTSGFSESGCTDGVLKNALPLFSDPQPDK